MLVVVALLSLIDYTLAKYSQGVISTEANWAFIERFCFKSQIGKLHYSIRYPKRSATQNLYLYYDTADQWPAVYRTGKTCLEKEAVLSIQKRQIVNLSVDAVTKYNWPGCRELLDDSSDELWLECQAYRYFNISRDRWWYIATGNCDTTQGLYLEYELWMSNGRAGDIWHYHFSADEFYILPMDIGFLGLELLLLSVSVVFSIMLRSRHMLHVTYRLYLGSLFFDCLGLIVNCGHYGSYAENGVGVPLFKLFGQIFRITSSLMFFLLLIYMAKGYTITRGKLSSGSQIKITLLMCGLAVTYLVLITVQLKFYDPGLVTYLYENVAGYLLVFLRIIAWIWFCYGVFLSTNKYPEKRCFYASLSLLSTIWFWCTPVVVIVCRFALGKWMREKVVHGIENTVSFLGFCIFLYITRPSEANTMFPYHVRTSQINDLAAKDTTGNGVSLPHHTYQPGPEPVDLDVYVVPVRRNTSATNLSVSNETAPESD